MAYYPVDLNGVLRPRLLYQFVGAAAFLPRRIAYSSGVKTAPFTEEIVAHGCGMLRGVLTEQGVPTRGRVAGLESYSLKSKIADYSDPATGKWTLYPLPMHLRYIVIGADIQTRFNAVCADGVRPVPWEEES